jgi:hypothetical protein
LSTRAVSFSLSCHASGTPIEIEGVISLYERYSTLTLADYSPLKVAENYAYTENLLLSTYAHIPMVPVLNESTHVLIQS